MGRLRLSKVARARAGYFAGALIIGAGVWLIAGAGWALVALGVLVVAYFIVLYDLDEKEKRVRASLLPPHLQEQPGNEDW